MTESVALPSLALLLVTATAWGGEAKLSKELKPGQTSGDVEVIAQFKATPNEANHRRIGNLGGSLKNKMDFIRAGHYSIPASALQGLSEDPDVEYVTPNRSLQGVTGIPALTVGAGIGVAVIDSGMPDIPDFNSARPNLMP
jgi:hypothetical protein